MNPSLHSPATGKIIGQILHFHSIATGLEEGKLNSNQLSPSRHANRCSLDSFLPSIHPYLLFIAIVLASLLGGIQCQHRAVECNFLLIGQHWCVCVLRSLGLGTRNNKPQLPVHMWDVTQGQFLIWVQLI